jgi:hypothetical protein
VLFRFAISYKVHVLSIPYPAILLERRNDTSSLLHCVDLEEKRLPDLAPSVSSFFPFLTRHGKRKETVEETSSPRVLLIVPSRRSIGIHRYIQTPRDHRYISFYILNKFSESRLGYTPHHITRLSTSQLHNTQISLQSFPSQIYSKWDKHSLGPTPSNSSASHRKLQQYSKQTLSSSLSSCWYCSR